MTLRGKVIDFVGLGFLNDPDQVGAICQVAMMKVEARRVLMRILIDILDTPGVERRRPTLQAVHDIALFKQQPRQIGAGLRSAERRVGKEGGSTCRSRWSRDT